MRDKIIAVIFEVTPKDGQKGSYLDIVPTLRLVVDKVKGFISVERVQYLTTQMAAHRYVQSKSHAKIFANYHTRICKLLRDYDIFAKGWTRSLQSLFLRLTFTNPAIFLRLYQPVTHPLRGALLP